MIIALRPSQHCVNDKWALAPCGLALFFNGLPKKEIARKGRCEQHTSSLRLLAHVGGAHFSAPDTAEINKNVLIY